MYWCFSVVTADRSQQDSRIHGGKEPPEGKYPSLVRIEYYARGICMQGGWFGEQVRYSTGTGSSQALTSLIARPPNSTIFQDSGLSWVIQVEITRSHMSRLFMLSDSYFMRNFTVDCKYSQFYHMVPLFQLFNDRSSFFTLSWKVSKQTAFDIAVAKVTPPIKFNNRVTAVNLPTCDESELGNRNHAKKSRTPYIMA